MTDAPVGGVPVQAAVGVEGEANLIPGPNQLNWTTSYELYAGQGTSFGEGNYIGGGQLGNGLLRWRVVRGGVESVWYSDMRPGLHFLGVCDKVFVDALRWKDNTVAVGQPGPLSVSCGLEIAQGGADFDEFTFTIERMFAADAAIDLFPYFRPPRARWFTPYVSTTAEPTIYTSTDTIIFNPGSTEEGFSCTAESVLFDGPGGALIPTKHRYEIGGSNIGMRISSLAALSQDILIGCRFYLAH
jgi:hypothetical protein